MNKISKAKVGLAGWRGMVGSVLVNRMREENDFDHIEPVFLSTSQAGQAGPDIQGSPAVLADAYDIDMLSNLDVIVTCQGSDYTASVHPKLRVKGWTGYWIDAASHLRGETSSVLVLDPLNRKIIDSALAAGKKDLIGANCTVSTMLMGLAGLFGADLVESAMVSSYQAVSGAGAKNVIELLAQTVYLGKEIGPLLSEPAQNILEIEKTATAGLRSPNLPSNEFGHPIVGNILPWIDTASDDGQSREEYKAQTETNSILGLSPDQIIIDSTCVRVGSMRSHAQSVFLELKQDLPLEEIEGMIKSAHEWVKIVPNTKEDTLRHLTPVATSGSLDIAVGRIRKLKKGPKHLGIFVVGDQLLWGAAEPLRRALRIAITA